MRAYLLLCMALICGHANAEDCSPVDLRALIGAPMNQGESGYCFAHTASTLIQARTGIRTSPMSLAMDYILTNPEELDGDTDPAVRAKLTPEFIAQWRKDRNDEPHNLDPDKILGMHGLIDTGGDEEPAILATNFLGLCPEGRLPTGRYVYKHYLYSIRAYHAARSRHGIPDEGPIGEARDFESQAKAWSFRHWVEDRCGVPVMLGQPLVTDSVSLAKNLRGFRRLQRLRLATTLRLEQRRVMDAVDRQLNRGNPVAIGYAIGDLMPNQANSKGDAPHSEDHASVFAARQRMGGRCYYYLRNSFGQEKDDYTPALRERFENGGVWVLPEEIPSLYSAVWLR